MKPSENAESKQTGRLEAFSDGVFAIAITLLILTIPVPPVAAMDHLAAFVGKQFPFFLAYVVSFLTILVMWANHHGIFNLVVRADRLFIFINGVLLMLITFLNYPTAVVAEAMQAGPAQQRFAAIFYSATLILITLLYQALWRYATYHNRLLDEHVDNEVVRKITREYRFGPVFYFAAFALAFVNVIACLALILGLAVYFGLTGQADPVHADRPILDTKDTKIHEGHEKS